MNTQCDYVMDRFRQDAYDNAYREAEKLRALRRAGLIQSARLGQIARRGLSKIGRLLVGLGQRLERAGAAANPAFHSPASLGNA